MSGSIYTGTIQSAASAYGVPFNLLQALIGQESSFNPNAQNGNAYGIAQFMPGTAADYGVDRSDATSSINGAAHYLSDLYQQTGSWASAVTRYGTVPSSGPQNAGQANVLDIANVADTGYSPNLLGTVPGFGAASILQELFPKLFGKPTTTKDIGNAISWIEGGIFRISIAVIAFLFIAIGLASLAFKSAPSKIVQQVVKKGVS